MNLINIIDKQNSERKAIIVTVTADNTEYSGDNNKYLMVKLPFISNLISSLMRCYIVKSNKIIGWMQIYGITDSELMLVNQLNEIENRDYTNFSGFRFFDERLIQNL